MKQNASPGPQSEAPRRRRKPGQEQHPGPENQDSQHMLYQPRGSFSDLWTLKRGGFPIWTCPSFFALFCPFPIFPGFSRFVRGLFEDFPDLPFFLFLGLLTAPTRNSPERVCDKIRTFPQKSGKPHGLETPRLSFSQMWAPDLWRICLPFPTGKGGIHKKVGGAYETVCWQHIN